MVTVLKIEMILFQFRMYFKVKDLKRNNCESLTYAEQKNIG